ncbi:MAG TPA: JDVT-CTERM system glutamic-type intramembrane protease [Nitrospira sp.]|nr:JDVT-CTERM system glutamic-type intramembrane protease [Nitrospira sp.]
MLDEFPSRPNSRIPAVVAHQNSSRCLLNLFGLDHCPPFYRDRVFLLAAAAGPVFWVALAAVTSVPSLQWSRIWSLSFLAVALWLPLVEELLFRGLIQGQLARFPWGRRATHGVTLANLATSMLFTSGHWFTHPPLWALSVLIPSLLFGLMRDRFQSTYPAVVLHALYNAGYFALTAV